jgi:UDP-N-acetyl-D-glucosamine dehydrogenase
MSYNLAYMQKIAVVGLGYVGLPLALLAEERDFDVLGIDLSKQKLALLKEKISPIADKDASNRLHSSKIQFTDDFTKLSEVDVAIVCVPTPVNENKTPDLSIVKAAALSAATNLEDGSLLIIESTINPGVCDEILIPAIEEQTNHKIGKTLFIAHCPERINPGDPKWHVGNINRVLGADSKDSLDMAYDFYSKLLDAKIKKMGSLKEAEAVKIVENSFRDINIAFVNELAMSFEKLGINVNNVIDGAATKPFAFMAHYPGIGVGGHCIPVDPYYLIEYAHGRGFEHHFLKLARSINEDMPVYAIDTIEKALIENAEGDLKGKKVTVLGLSYKANIGDARESPAKIVIRTLEQRGAIVTTFDPYFLNISTAKTLPEALKNTKIVILVTAHDEFKSINPADLAGSSIFLDGRNALADLANVFSEYNIKYIGIGS